MGVLNTVWYNYLKYMEPKITTQQTKSLEGVFTVYEPRILPTIQEVYIAKDFKFNEGVVYEEKEHKLMKAKFVTWYKIGKYTYEIVCSSARGIEYQFGFTTVEFEDAMVRLQDAEKEVLYHRIADFLETVWPQIKARGGIITCSFSNNYNTVVDGRYIGAYKDFIPYILSGGRAGKARMVRAKFIGEAFKKYLKNWSLIKTKMIGQPEDSSRSYHEYDLIRKD